MTRPRDADRRSGPGPWRPVTRRAFLNALGTALGAAAAVLAVQGGARRWIPDGCDDDDRPHSRWTGTTRWIGHC